MSYIVSSMSRKYKFHNKFRMVRGIERHELQTRASGGRNGNNIKGISDKNDQGNKYVETYKQNEQATPIRDGDNCVNCGLVR